VSEADQDDRFPVIAIVRQTLFKYEEHYGFTPPTIWLSALTYTLLLAERDRFGARAPYNRARFMGVNLSTYEMMEGFPCDGHPVH